MKALARIQPALDLAAHVPRLRRLVVSQSADLVADWIALVALLVLSWELTGDVRAAALVITARLLPRVVLIATSNYPLIGNRALAGIAGVRAALVASLALVSVSADLYWGLPAILLASVMMVVVDGARSRAVAEAVPRLRLGTANGLIWVVSRLAFVVGPLLGAMLLVSVTPAAALLVAAGMLVVSAVMLAGVHPSASSEELARPAEALRYVRARPALVLAAGSLFVSGVVAVSLQLALVVLLAETFNRSHAVLGLLFAATGVGMLLGPLPIPKLLVRIPSALLLVGNTLLVAAVLPFTRAHASLTLLGVSLLVVGIVGVTNDMLVTTLARRSVPPELLAAVGRVLATAATAGQLAAALGVVLFASGWTGQVGLLLVALACGTLVITLLLRDDVRGLVASLRPQADTRA